MACPQIVVRGYGAFGGIEYLATLGYASTEFVFAPAAPCRTLYVGVESRTLVVPFESRILVVPHENRTLEVRC